MKVYRFLLAPCVLFVPIIDSFANGQVVPQFGTPATRKFTTMATRDNGLNLPRDLEFNPDVPNQLWVVNQADDSALIVKNAGTDQQIFDKRIDRYGHHFMEEVSSMAFGARTYRNAMTFATCQESRNTYNNSYPANDFMGPTLWPAGLDLFARANQNNNLLGSHIDMNHQSPLCMGIAHQAENKYWVFDGKNANLVYYDFQRDHDTGHDDHSDAIVRRYSDVELTRIAGVPSHMALDTSKRWLYIADTGASRVLRVDISTGEFSRRLRASNEPLHEYSEYKNIVQEEFATQSLTRPSGVALHGSLLFVGDYLTGDIVAYDTISGAELDRVATGAAGLMGLTVGPDQRLWFVNGRNHTLTRLDP